MDDESDDERALPPTTVAVTVEDVKVREEDADGTLLGESENVGN